jgi:hypothetical protein
VAVETDADRAIFTSADDFGTLVRIDPDGIALDVAAIFDMAHEMVDASGELPVSTTMPVVLGRDSDLDMAVDGSIILARAIRFEVVDRQPDGTGMTRLILKRVTA